MKILRLINILGSRQNGRVFADKVFKSIFLNDSFWFSNKISLKYVPFDSTVNISALVQIIAWRWIDDKSLSEPMLGYFTDASMRRPTLMNYRLPRLMILEKTKPVFHWCEITWCLTYSTTFKTNSYRITVNKFSNPCITLLLCLEITGSRCFPHTEVQ